MFLAYYENGQLAANYDKLEVIRPVAAKLSQGYKTVTVFECTKEHGFVQKCSYYNGLHEKALKAVAAGTGRV